jgi:hypothetical protein
LITAFAIERGRIVMLLAFSLTVLGGLGQVERALLPIFPLATALHPLGVMVFATWLCIYARDWQSEALQGRRAAVSYWPRRLSQPMLWGAAQGLTDYSSRGR